MSEFRKKFTWVFLVVFTFSIFSGLTVTTADTTYSDGIPTVAEQDQSVELQWYLPGEEPDGLDEIAEKLNERLKDKTDTLVNFNFIGWSDFDKRKELLFAAGETVDLIFTANWLGYSSDASNGLYYPISGLIDKYASKTKAELGKTILKGAEVNGEIFALPVPGQTTANSSGILFRKDLVKKYNINLSKIKKLADVEPILKTIKARQPSILPLVNNSSDLNYDLIGSEFIENGFQIPGALSSSGKDNKIYNEFARSETMAYFKTLNKFYKAGYLKKSSNYNNDLSKGKIFAELMTNVSPMSGTYRQGYDWTAVNLGKPVFNKNSTTNAMNAVGSDSRYPERALGLLEFINNDSTSSNLLHFGIEGKHYVKLSGNVIDYPRGASASSPAYSQSINFMAGNTYLDFTWKNEDPNMYKNLKAFNKGATAARSLGFEFNTAPVQKEADACGEVWDKYVLKLLSGEYNPVKYLPTVNSALKKAGLDKILAEKQKQYDVWLDNNAPPLENTSGIKLLLGGESLTLKYPPAFSKGIVMVPMKQIFDSLNAVSGYDVKTGAINASRGGSSLKLVSGSAQGTLNGKAVKLAAPTEKINKQVYIPLESVCKIFGCDYKWDKDKKTAEITDSFTEKKGNSWGNTANYGYAALDGDWQYMSVYDEGIFKIKNDGSEKVRLNDKAASYLNVSDGWLYYSNTYNTSETEKQTLYRMKTDGSSKTRLTDHQVSYVNQMGEWIYYINITDGGRPYRIGLSGKNCQKLSNDPVITLYAEDGWLYFQKKADNKLYKMRTSGTDVKKLTDSVNKYNEFLQKIGEWIYYYATENSKKGIYKMKADGSGKQLVAATSFEYINIYGGVIYYSDFSMNLFKIDEAEKTRVKIGTGIESDLNIAGDWIYYTQYVENYDEDTTDATEYRIKTDGSVKQKIGKDGGLTDIYRIPAENGVSPRPVIPSGTMSSNVVKTAKEIVKYKDAVVYIKIYDEDGNVKASGSGFNIESSGTVVTNFHVISGASRVTCTFDDNTAYDIDYVLNYDSIRDIAILKLKGASGLPVVNLGDSGKVELADDVLAIGNPLELQNTISDGIVSGVRTIFGITFIQTTASISSGSSGGPLFNAYGDVIGITSMTLLGAQNINFAVPINSVRKLFAAAHYIPLPAINNYDDEVIEFESNNDTGTATVAGVDKTISGSIDGSGDVDFYRLEITSDGIASVYGAFDTSLKGDDAVTAFNMKLLDQNGTLLTESSITSEEGFSIQKLSYDLKVGTYYLSVARSGSSKSIAELSDYSILCIQN